MNTKHGQEKVQKWQRSHSWGCQPAVSVSPQLMRHNLVTHFREPKLHHSSLVTLCVDYCGCFNTVNVSCCWWGRLAVSVSPQLMMHNLATQLKWVTSESPATKVATLQMSSYACADYNMCFNTVDVSWYWCGRVAQHLILFFCSETVSERRFFWV